MAIQFGKTWWGEHWLRSLENVDYDNRLPRGASYARNGYVKDVKIKGNQIAAKVAGSRPRPYNVTVIVPPFFEDQVEALMNGIVQRPALISKLLNRELDPEILTIAEQNGLKVFPRQWTDFKMQCSCPDWAVPCKHLAAVIYMISREIDNNPFLVFEIHNVNLLDELKKRGIFIDDQKKTEILSLSKLLKVSKKKPEDYDEEKAYQRVDFSKLNDISESVVLLLPDAPPFYSSGNFREKFNVQFTRNARDAKRILSKKLFFEALYPAGNKKKPEINYHTTLSYTIDNNNRTEIAGENHTFSSNEQLLPALFSLNPDRLPDYQPSVAAFHKILYASLHLIANGNVVPQIVQLDNKEFIIRWLPTSIDAEVRVLISRLIDILPPNLFLILKETGKTKQLLPLENQVQEVLSVFITGLVTKFSKPSNGDLIEDLFFKNKSHSFLGVGEHALSGGIKVWLDRFFLSSNEFRPIIAVSELNEDLFDVQISFENRTDPNALPIELSKILTQKQYEKQRFKILQSLSLLSSFIKGLDNYINTETREQIHFDISEFSPFLVNIIPAIKLLDIQVLLPKSLQHLLKPQASVKLKSKSVNQGYVRLDDLLAFDWQVALGDVLVSPEEFKNLMKNASGLFRFKEKYIYVSEEEIAKLKKLFESGRELNSYELLQAALAEEFNGARINLTDEVRDMIRELTSNEDIPLPTGLNAQLRPYQQRGFSWMYRNSRIGFGSIIADDMGLGKTLQVIAILLKLKEEEALDKHKALVVVPTGLLTNWQAEIAKFAPSVSTHIFHGSARDIKQFQSDVMLTTYGILRSDAELMKKQKWQIMVIDEAQNIKNHDTVQAKAIKSIPSIIRIAMSGTPVENRLTEFWSIMEFANKGYLGNIKTFKSNFADPIQVFNDEKAVAKFRKVTSPFMMRRMKTDKTIISDLPDKVEQNQFALLTKPQAALYEKTMQAAFAEIEGLTGADGQSLFKREGLVLQMIMALKQICNHPTNFLKNGNHDPLISGKMELIFELLDSIVEAGEKVLIFTQYKEMGSLLERFITERFGEKPMFYHGGSTIPQRQEMVERFQHNRADKIFILSLKAAGTGLNLTAASHVIHYDLWWNPAVENQATDRAYRIGQKKNVMVHRFITKNTFEEKIDDMIQKKKHLADMTVATGENWLGKLSNKELREIFE